MKWLSFFISAILTIALVWALNTKLGDIPPLGKLMSPFTGFWQNNESGKMSAEELKIPGLKDKVTILLDDNLVPHIFAKNNHDLFFAQGYIHAKYRLWQMEFQTLAAAGRISEIIGDKALEYDRQQRRFGMVYGAENTEKALQKDPESKEAADAYTDGVNTWINSLSEKDFPVEYKLLDYKPEPWTPLKCALLLKYMSYDLAGHSNDFYATNVLKKYGIPAIDSLFSNHPYINDPIIPIGTPLDFSPLQIPPPPQSYIADVTALPFDHQPNPDNGSNNWAVNGSKTVSGSPILCGDPHLSLSLPSLWYEMQLVSPDYNVSGVSLPGTPCIIIGFNQQIAWSETNVDADVLDWYSVKFKDASCKEYFYNNEWKPTTKRVEVIKVRGAKDVIDTVIYTKQGPVVGMPDKESFYKNVPAGFAMRWLGHDATMELKAVLDLNRAKNYDEYVDALKNFQCPAQNFVYADADNNIAIWVNGKYPEKWKDQGKFLMDGTNPAYEWQGWIPHEQDPHVKNPMRGFVSSANQTPADSTYPYYLNWQFEAFTRGHHINERLAQMNHITADSMRMLQDDATNIVAENVLAPMLSYVDQSKLNDVQKQILLSLTKWNFVAATSSSEQSVFNEWWNNLKAAIWNDEFGSSEMMFPNTDISVQTVAKNVNRQWIDNKNTPEAETLGVLVNATFIASVDSLTKNYGADLKQWSWGKVKSTHISHLLRIPAFSHTFVNAAGGALMVNATGADHGPSWRMIVELGKQPHAFGIYPGGQSGNPGSPFYDNMIDRWSNGLQNELLILNSEADKNSRILGSLILKN